MKMKKIRNKRVSTAIKITDPEAIRYLKNSRRRLTIARDMLKETREIIKNAL